LVGGWGNVGGGVTQIVMGTLLFPLFRDVFFDGDSEKAWRTVCVVPAFIAFLTGLLVLYTSEDCPEGNYKELKKTGRMPEVSAAASFRKGAINLNTWLLYIQYGCCFGVELTMNNAAATYFVDEFGLTTETASAVASIFGFMNIFARGLGGFVSDKAMSKIGMKGRLLTQMMFLLLEGACIFIFSLMEDLWSAVLMLTIFSIFVQAAEGSTYGIVPYVDPAAPGAVSGIVGAGGPSGAVAFGFGFLFLSKIRDAYMLMASGVIVAGLLSLFINIKGHGGIFFKGPEDEALKAGDGGLVIPEIAEKGKVEEEENDA
jgi:NNP family nitrate/nitrite transporter-like MFS transporter